eukprot:TRINITY_DN33658_c0_g1_i1.p1 TRINITY_DN33658_c0_g1~~TRINITY_DN33658_c0_g1_i1.p1  ORF type:complete len:814 (+),score=145.43 TRINITY_DN33658_c0_g1_i1:85-2526(+)
MELGKQVPQSEDGVQGQPSLLNVRKPLQIFSDDADPDTPRIRRSVRLNTVEELQVFSPSPPPVSPEAGRITDRNDGTESGIGLDRQVSEHSQASSSSILELRNQKLNMLHATADGRMPLTPWCGKCMSVRVDGVLPLLPDELDIAAKVSVKERATAGHGLLHTSWARAKLKAEGVQKLAPAGVMQGKTLFTTGVPRINQFAKRMVETIEFPCAFSERQVDWPEELILLPGMVRSRFSSEKYAGPKEQLTQPDIADSEDSSTSGEAVPPVLRSLRTADVSKLEIFAHHHVKQQIINSTAKANASNLNAKRAKNVFKFGSVMQLIRSRKAKANSETENKFLKMKLKEAPFVNNIPDELFDSFLDLVDCENITSGNYLFRQGDEANTIFVILQGEVELRSDNAQDLEVADCIKEAPAVMLQEDVLDAKLEKSQPFMLRSQDDRLRSRTAVAATGVDASPYVTTLVVTLEALELVSRYYRAIEAQERLKHLEFFAQRQRIPLQVCLKHPDIFSVELVGKSHLFYQEGMNSDLKESKVHMVIEGELLLVYPAKTNRFGLRRGKGPKQAFGRGKFIGEAALYGETHTHSALTTQDTMILSIKAADYLQKLMGKPGLLERPMGYVPPAAPEVDEDDLPSRRKVADEIFESRKKSMRIAADSQHLTDTDWKYLAQKDSLPKRVSPTFAGATKESECNVQGAYGLEDESPFAMKSQMQQARDAKLTTSLKTPIAGAACGPVLGMLSLDRKISSRCSQLAKLKAEHYSHSVYGYHMEDISGRATPETPVLAARPGSVLLMACGSMSPRPQSKGSASSPLSIGF